MSNNLVNVVSGVSAFLLHGLFVSGKKLLCRVFIFAMTRALILSAGLIKFHTASTEQEHGTGRGTENDPKIRWLFGLVSHARIEYDVYIVLHTL